jgi:BlaI family transcriptional regulator, penicillinase repressor
MAETGPSPRELEILKVLWELGEASVREVHERMCPRGECAFNTIQTLLRIMDDKGLVTHTTRGRTFVYRASYSREREAARLLDAVFDGAVDQFVLSLLKAKTVSSGELEELERIIAEARRQRGGRRRNRKKKEA